MTDRVQWIMHSEVDTSRYKHDGWMGGYFKPPMRWPDYIDGISPKRAADLELIRASIIQNRIWVSGDAHQSDEQAYVPLVDGVRCYTWTFRAWGDLLAAVWSTELNRDMHYMDFYFAGTADKPW